MKSWKNPSVYTYTDPEPSVSCSCDEGKPHVCPVGRFVATLKPVRVEQDFFGRVYLDACETELDHFTKPDPVFERKGCRVYLDEILEHLIGKKGTIFIAVDFEEEKK